MRARGYYRFPAIHGDALVFVSEDDLWAVSVGGGTARRLTANSGPVSYAAFSPDGRLLAFTGNEEGHAEVYVMPSDGGPVQRVTYLGATSTVLGWTPDGEWILFGSDAGQPFERVGVVHAVRPTGGLPVRWPVGPAVSISIAEGGATVLGRNSDDPARWKRYRGGRAGDLWVDPDGSGSFRRLVRLDGNVARPMWVGGRIFFVSDHEGIGNLYSVDPTGDDLERHTHRTDYFVRFPSSDGRRIAYHAGADLFVFDPETGDDHAVDVVSRSPRSQRHRKFVDAAEYLEAYALHPEGHSLAVTARGRSFLMGNWEGAVPQLRASGENGGHVRRRLVEWLNGGRRVVAVANSGDGDVLELHDVEGLVESEVLETLDVGRVYELRVSPSADELVLSNHRNELIHVDLATKTARVVDRSPFRHVQGLSWSPDGQWVAYGFSGTQYTTAIRLWRRGTDETRDVTNPVLNDTQPVFDPDGDHLYFLGQRVLDPVYDNLGFDLGFPRGMRPYVITLRAELTSPFAPEPQRLKDPADEIAEAQARKAAGAPEVVVDFDGIENRVVAFPVPEGIYVQLQAVHRRVLFSSLPVEGALTRTWSLSEPTAKAALEAYDFKEQRHQKLVDGITDFRVSGDGRTVAYRAGRRLRVVRAASKPDEKTANEPPSRTSGWIDLGRVKVEVDPGAEWRQMAREAWRLQREYFWTEDMSHVDWDAVWDRYEPLVDRVGTRGEFSDLVWEMQGELGTSHAYEMGGDYRAAPSYPQGFLGADLVFDRSVGEYVVAHIVQGTPGEAESTSPLNAPGVNVRPGDRLLAVNGRRLAHDVLPQQLLVHRANAEVTLTVAGLDGAARTVPVRTVKSEFPARYREWVEGNRRRVHEETDGRSGYVHVPDMGPRGFAEFHRLFLAEADRDALLVDVRYNRGGHVSQLLIEKLARKRVGYDVNRWGAPAPYPEYSVAGPMVALTNEFAGSDGDIFSHVFKLMGLGPLVGKRTWGGVIGIWPRNTLSDGSFTTQPEFSFWFQDVGWGVENYGTDPDVEVDVAPQDYAAGRDPQLERAIAIVLERLESAPPERPRFDERPDLAPRILF